MQTLEEQQHALLDLIKGRGGEPPDDPYLAEVVRSPGLAMVREIALWWRALPLTVQCRFTSRLLKRMSRFDEAVAAHFRAHATSNFVEEFSRHFLHMLASQSDPLLAALAQFEYALMEARDGSSESFEICWDRDPDAVILALEQHGTIPSPDPDWTYRMHVCADAPEFVRCTRERMLRFKGDDVDSLRTNETTWR
jgi:hypothetical protein